MNVIRYGRWQIKDMMKQERLDWIPDHFNRPVEEWNFNIARLIAIMELWCQDCGICRYGITQTQIALVAVFTNTSDAMMFKLRWHKADRDQG